MKRLLALGLLSVIALTSCKKDNTTDPDTAKIQGTYKLKYLTAKTNSTITVSDGEKAVTTSDYTTINNQGTFVFDNSNLTATGMAYGVESEATAYLYQDNELLDSIISPFNFTLPATDAVAAYQLIGADSIYFPHGSLTSGVDGTGAMETGASGGRYSLAGSLLTITQNVSRDSTFLQSGETVHMKQSAISSVVLEKQ